MVPFLGPPRGLSKESPLWVRTSATAASPENREGGSAHTDIYPSIIASMLRASEKISDLIFSPGRAPQMEINGQLAQLNIAGVGLLSAEDTARIAADLIGRNAHAVDKLEQEGSCDISYSLPKLSRFRVNVFTQRGSCAIVMRVIASNVPDFNGAELADAACRGGRAAPGNRFGHRPDGQRQILHPGRPG